MAAPNLILTSEVQTVSRRDFPLADTTVLNPFGANPLLDGEFLDINGSYQAARGSGEEALPSYAVFAEKGRYDTQALGKTTLLYLGMYEADTLICSTTGLSVGSPLTVQDLTIGGLTRRGLALKSGSAKMVVGFVSKLYAGQTKLRFVHFGLSIQQ